MGKQKLEVELKPEMYQGHVSDKTSQLNVHRKHPNGVMNIMRRSFER